MATEIKTWQINDGKLISNETSLVKEGKTEAYDLEEWIATTPIILGPEIVIIGRQVQTQSGPLDLLGIDRSGNTIIIELKRDKLPRVALAQAIDYASDVANWSIDKIGEICAKHTEYSLEDLLTEKFPDINLEELGINEAQRIILVGFSIESSLERMINWLSNSYDMSINALLMKYTKTSRGDELLIKTSIISEEIEQQKIKKKKSFKVPMSNEPGTYDIDELGSHLSKYFSKKTLWSAMRIRKVLIPACFEHGVATRDILKEEFVKRGFAETESQAGSFMSLISSQFGHERNDFLRQVIKYEFPNYHWEKDNYSIKSEYSELVNEVIEGIDDSDWEMIN